MKCIEILSWTSNKKLLIVSLSRAYLKRFITCKDLRNNDLFNSYSHHHYQLIYLVITARRFAKKSRPFPRGKIPDSISSELSMLLNFMIFVLIGLNDKKSR